MSSDRTPRQGALTPGEGVAIPVTKGESLRIVNLEGGQVVDTWALNAEDPSEVMSMEHTRIGLLKLMPAAGDDLFSNRRRPLLRLAEDRSPGIHDTLMPACDAERYRQLGAAGDHASCCDTYVRALATRGTTTPSVPAPLNLFMNIPWAPDGTVSFEAAPAAAGDFVKLTAVLDAIVVLSVCPMDLNPINGGRLTAIGYELTP